MVGHDKASHAHDTANGGHDTAKGGHYMIGSARAEPSWGTMSRYNKLYHDRRQLGYWVVS